MVSESMVQGPSVIYADTPGFAEVTGSGDVALNLVKPHVNQAKILKSKARFRVCCTARRFGKTELAKISVTIRAFRKSSVIWYCSPTYQNSERVFREFIRLLKDLPPEIVTINRTNMRIEIEAGDLYSTIEFKSLKDPDNLRGAGLDYAVVDEAAFVDDGIWETIIEPMLLSSDGDALIISTPKGVNWFKTMFLLGEDPDQPDYESFHFTVYDNPMLRPNAVEAIRKRIPDHIWKQEYLAEFADSGGAVFKKLSGVVRDWAMQEKIAQIHDDDDAWKEARRGEKGFVKDMLDLSRQGKASIVFGVDIGQIKDYSVISVFDLDSQSLVVQKRINQMTWEELTDLIKEMNEEWSPLSIIIESNNASALIEAMEKDGLPVLGLRTTSKSKPEMIQRLAIAIENGEISIPKEPTLLNELEAFKMEFTPSGNVKYGAPSGYHDDCVMSLAVALRANEDVYTAKELEVVSA